MLKLGFRLLRPLLGAVAANPYVIGAVALAVVGVIGGGLIWYRVQINRAEERGAVAERMQWQTEMALLAEEHRRERVADEIELRDIGLELNDTRTRLREQRDAADQDFLALEQEDAAAGAAANSFDSRVLHIVR